MRAFLRRLRGAFGTASVWATSWFFGAFGLVVAWFLTGSVNALPFWPTALITAVNFAGIGFLTGGAFSVYLGIIGRRKRIEELRPGRFALGGGMVAGIVVPVLTLLTLPAGVSVPILPVLAASAATSGVFGGVTALLTIKLGQRALPRGEEHAAELESDPERVLLP